MYSFTFVHFVPFFFFSSLTIKASAVTVWPEGTLQSHNVALWRMCHPHVVPLSELGRPSGGLNLVLQRGNLQRNVYSHDRVSSFQDFQNKRQERPNNGRGTFNSAGIRADPLRGGRKSRSGGFFWGWGGGGGVLGRSQQYHVR